TTLIDSLPLHDALPISLPAVARLLEAPERGVQVDGRVVDVDLTGTQTRRDLPGEFGIGARHVGGEPVRRVVADLDRLVDRVVAENRKSTRLNSSHVKIS